MVRINEWLPNPIGKDAGGEWVELHNAGPQTANLAGWRLVSDGGKKFIFRNAEIPPNGYLVLRRDETKLTLRNENGKLFLYDDKGALIDSAAFFGSAPEGRSFVRHGEVVIPQAPTPGKANLTAMVSQVVNPPHMQGVPLNKVGLSSGEILLLALGVGALFAAGALVAVKTNETLSHVFFKRNETVR